MCSDMHEQGDSQHQDKHVGKKYEWLNIDK